MPFDRSKYPADWPQIRARILARAGHRCECSGQCGSAHDGGRCGVPHGAGIIRHGREPWRWRAVEDVVDALHELGDAGIEGHEERRPITAVLTTAHYPDKDPSNCAESNLLALCNRCHLVLDKSQHIASARETRRRRRALGDLPGVRS